jgi:hypothetical protein
MNKTFGLIATILTVVFVALFIFGPSFFSVTYDLAGVVAGETVDEVVVEKAGAKIVPDERPVIEHIPLPSQAKTIYMTSCVAGTPSFRQKLVALIGQTEVNSVIIDVKDYSGTISFPASSTSWGPAWQEARCGTRDMQALIQMLHDNDIYVIARITVFQDPFYAKLRPDLAVKKADGITNWEDNKGLAFIDVAATEYWDHIVDLSVDSYNIGFDELNFDYVRYPSDGPMGDISFPHSMAGEYGADKQANLEAFFKYLNEALDDESRFAMYNHQNTGRASSTPYTSADLFGMTTTNWDDLSIGQVLERTVPYFDFTVPMVYPSHYPNDYLGLGNPNDHPYEVVNHAMQSGVNRLQASTTRMQSFTHERIGTSTPAVYKKPVYEATKLRTWIQDFDYGGDYDAADVRAQIQASYDAGVMSWMIWAPSNIYTKAALLAPGVLEVSTTTTAQAE